MIYTGKRVPVKIKIASRKHYALTVKTRTNCVHRAVGKTGVYHWPLELPGGHRAGSREARNGHSFPLASGEYKPKAALRYKRDLPKGVCDRVIYNHRMLEPAHTEASSGPGAGSHPGMSWGPQSQQVGYFSSGNRAHPGTWSEKSKITTSPNCVR